MSSVEKYIVELGDGGTKLIINKNLIVPRVELRIGKYEIHIDPRLKSFNILVKDTETDKEKYLRCQNGTGGIIFASKFEITETLQYRTYYVRGRGGDSWSEWKSLENN